MVDWWEVHTFIDAVVKANPGHLPTAGTPAWCELADDDIKKLIALAVAGEHHVLRVEVDQAAAGDASRAISASTDWSQLAREITQRRDTYIRRIPETPQPRRTA